MDRSMMRTEARHVALIREQVPNISEQLARRAYREANGDIVNAIMELTNGTYESQIREEEARRIELVREQVPHATREQAIEALENNSGDIVNAIMELTMGSPIMRRVRVIPFNSSFTPPDMPSQSLEFLRRQEGLHAINVRPFFSRNEQEDETSTTGLDALERFFEYNGPLIDTIDLSRNDPEDDEIPPLEDRPLDLIPGENAMEPVEDIPHTEVALPIPQRTLDDVAYGEALIQTLRAIRDGTHPGITTQVHPAVNTLVAELAALIIPASQSSEMPSPDDDDYIPPLEPAATELQGFVIHDSTKTTPLKQHSPEAARTPWATFGEWAFYRAISAPEDWEDLYGEPFQTRDRVYAFVDKSQPDKMAFYSSEELIASFLHHEDFVDPKRKGEKFTTEQIDRLLRLSEGIANVANHPTPENPGLAAVIREVRLFQQDVLRSMKKLSSTPHFKEALEKIFKIGMTMRGWTGEGEYPLRANQTHGTVDHVKLSEELLDLKGKLESDWKDLKGIRLVKYEKSWKTNEMTLWERLQVVLQGSRVEACIRMTSGLFAQTSWFYSNSFFQEQPFNLNTLENVA